MSDGRDVNYLRDNVLDIVAQANKVHNTQIDQIKAMESEIERLRAEVVKLRNDLEYERSAAREP